MTQTPRKWLPFLDWHDIWPGATGYDPDGRAWISEAPSGVRLSIQQAQKSAPLIVNDRPWEGAVLGGGVTVLQDGGRYRMWYCSGLQGGGLCYAESEDGFAWRKPHLGLIERDGSSDNNLVYPHGVAGNIFRDPSADEAERYKLVDLDSSWVHQGKDIPEPEALRLREALLNASSTQEEIEQQLSVRGAVYGAVSPDGLRWTRIAEPLFTMFCDTQNIVHYDEQSQRYVGHWRASAGRRRSIARSETADFRHWPLPEIVLQPDGQTPPTDDYYTNGYARYPGKSDLHLMFPSVYHRATDTVDVQLAISRDGFNWSWPERRPIVGMGPSGSGESGWVYAGCGLHALGSDQWGLIYDGGDVRHNVSYYAQPAGKDGQIRWALWQRDRLVALDAPLEGQVTLNKQRCSGEPLLLNYQTEANGWIQVELIEPTLWPPAHLAPIPGYAFADCTPLQGDNSAAAVHWQGSADLSALRGREICMRIRLCRAKLFALSL